MYVQSQDESEDLSKEILTDGMVESSGGDWDSASSAGGWWTASSEDGEETVTGVSAAR